MSNWEPVDAPGPFRHKRIMNDAEALQFIDRMTWTRAKTMPHLPHEYIVQQKLAGQDAEDYLAFRQFIRDNGEPRVIGKGKRIWVCWYAPDGKRYWEIDYIINRGFPDSDQTRPA